MSNMPLIRWYETLNMNDLALVGGKNASIGEMTGALAPKGILIPQGFATTADAYWHVLEKNELKDVISGYLSDYREDRISLAEAGLAIRRRLSRATIPEDLAEEIVAAYRELSKRYHMREADVAVRSSATAEDLPDASFAGQQESFLNISGEHDLLRACQKCYASLFTDRAIVYREAHGFDHMKVALSIGVQKMVRSDKSGAGVMFTLDTESGFPDVVLINAAWGLGELIVKGSVTPDQYMVFKPTLLAGAERPIIEKRLGTKEKKMVYASGGSHQTKSIKTVTRERQSFVLSDAEIIQLSRWAVVIENHYGMPMDIEWARDGDTEKMYIVQARPETVKARDKSSVFKTYTLKKPGQPLLTGLSVGSSIATGVVSRVLDPSDIASVAPGSILVTEMTDPDWVPAMRHVAAIVSDLGGRTCHAAIVARELGIPAIVGTGNGTEVLKTGQDVTVSCAGGEEGHVFGGILEFETTEQDLDQIPATETKIMINLATPDSAFQWYRLPADGVGLARMEFIISEEIRIHPMAIVRFDELKDKSVRREIEKLTSGYDKKQDYFVDRLARGIAKIAASQYPEKVIVRTSDFKTNEYANLLGGQGFEPTEENPMLGWRGASRYYSEEYMEGFALECRALRSVRDEMGLTNVAVMIPFCRTPEEADRVLDVMASNELHKGENGLEIYVMCEIPSNVFLARKFARRFDGLSIGSNDLTQLVLGVDRDSTRLAYLFDERDEAVTIAIRAAIDGAHAEGATVGICGQAPSDYPDFVDFLVHAGIDSISVNPDSFIGVKHRVAEAEGAAIYEHGELVS
jgi:pyruvate,water dikinase